MKKYKNFRGFTLLELLIVIAIIGLIASVIFASVSSARAGSRDTKKITELKSMVNALNLYFSANGYYPQTSAVLAPTYIPTIPIGIHYTGLSTLSSGQCAAYHIGVTLEKNNAVLNNDKDMTSNNTGLFANSYTDRCGNDSTAVIRGQGATPGTEQTCKTGDVGSYCFDLVP